MSTSRYYWCGWITVAGIHPFTSTRQARNVDTFLWPVPTFLWPVPTHNQLCPPNSKLFQYLIENLWSLFLYAVCQPSEKIDCQNQHLKISSSEFKWVILSLCLQHNYISSPIETRRETDILWTLRKHRQAPSTRFHGWPNPWGQNKSSRDYRSGEV